MRHLECEEFARRVRVSIHASVKDATGLEVQLTKAQAVSIHASVKDATLLDYFSALSQKFQSTHL